MASNVAPPSTADATRAPAGAVVANSDSPAPGIGADFDADDAWTFLRRWEEAKNRYCEECKKMYRLEMELAIKDVQL